MRRLRAAAGVCGALAATAAATPCSGQSGFASRLSADTVEVGEEFSLLVRIPVPAGSTVHFPDTVARTDFLESHGSVRWDAAADPSGGALLTLEYPVLAFAVGTVPVPGFDVFVHPSAGRAVGTSIPGGSLVGSWEDARAGEGSGTRPLRVPRHGIWVNPVFTPEQVEAGLLPMPSADVIGKSWHWPSLLAASGFLSLLALSIARSVPVWPRVRRGTPADARATRWTPEASRRRALDELARLVDEGLPARGLMQELYTRSSGVVRGHISRIRPDCGADLTSTELMTHLDADARTREDTLMGEMATAEVVKFGRLRPSGEIADAHLRSLRAWLEGPGSAL